MAIGRQLICITSRALNLASHCSIPAPSLTSLPRFTPRTPFNVYHEFCLDIFVWFLAWFLCFHFIPISRNDGVRTLHKS
jgi:hypothetical protein